MEHAVNGKRKKLDDVSLTTEYYMCYVIIANLYIKILDHF